MNLFTRWLRGEERSLPPGAVTVGPSGGLLPTWSGSTVDADAAMRLSAVWACVRLLADTVSTLPVHVYREGEREPGATPLTLEEPAAGQPLHEFVYSTMVSLLLRGNAFGIVTARSGATLLPVQVELVHPDKVSVMIDPSGAVVYRLLGREVDREDVWHVRAFTMPGAVLGLSPVEYARQAIGLGLAAEEFGAKYFGEGTVPSGVLTTADRLDETRINQLGDQWKAARTKSRSAAILSGDLKWTPLSVNAEESQFLEAQRFNVAQIARVFGINPELIGSDAGNSLTYSNVEARAVDYLRYSLAPWLVRLESALSRLLPRTWHAKFNTGGLLRADTKTRYEAHAIGLASGFLTINEVRELEDRAPLRGGDVSRPRSTVPAPNSNGSGTDVGVVT